MQAGNQEMSKSDPIQRSELGSFHPCLLLEVVVMPTVFRVERPGFEGPKPQTLGNGFRGFKRFHSERNLPTRLLQEDSIRLWWPGLGLVGCFKRVSSLTIA